MVLLFSPRGISLKKVEWLGIGVKVGVEVEVKVGVGELGLVVRVRWTALNTGLAKVKMT